MKRKGFTLIELLVVIAIIALLMSILMPALARVRELANRVVCGTNLKGIGTAMMTYANDDDGGRFPRAGWPNGTLGGVANWEAPAKEDAFANTATITSSLWLLVKRDYTTAKQFFCRSDDKSVGDFSHAQYFEVWDFGGSPGGYCSYAYHLPYNNDDGLRALTAASDPGMAACADRSPGGDGNSQAHQDEGQNVLFVDSHVKFEKKPNVGVNSDNIYTVGDVPNPLFDSFLLNAD